MLDRCSSCTIDPFRALFGKAEEKPPKKEKKKKKKKKSSDVSGSSSSLQSGSSPSSGSSGGSKRRSSKSSGGMSMRNEDEIKLLVDSWENYVHPRGKEFWRDHKQLREVLAQIARGCRKADDPILGKDTVCVTWHGEYSENENLPIVHMIQPSGDPDTQSFTSVTRLLVFLYADEESFAELQTRETKAFNMACGNLKCINLTHISLDD